MSKELGIWGFCWFELSSVPYVLWLLLTTSLWEGFLVGLVEMGLVIHGRKLSLHVLHHGRQLSRSGSSMLTPN